jgi:tRNA(Arg) A34 adenosine deaminase TadA
VDEDFLRIAVEEARDGIQHAGGPFGAVIVRDGRVLARGNNRVTATHDPTAHAEVVAIRAACQALGDHRLLGATLYASTEPCPLCLAASYWARIERIVFASTREDAARAGFDDAAIYRELALPSEARSLPASHLPLPEARAVLEAWVDLPNKVPY